MSSIGFFIKRNFDIIISIFILIFALPLNIIIIILHLIFMPGSILFKQKRIGLKGREFIIYKYRTMVIDEEAESKIDTSKDLSRITKLGYLLRRTKLDELPQFINVLKGDMSIVGPRPTIKRQVEKYTEYEMKRLEVRPGITGLAQVNGGTKIPWSERIDLDIYYINKMSIMLDFKIIIKTILVILRGNR